MNRLDIYDGPDEQSMKIGEIYGNSKNKLLKSISSSENTLFIDFKKQWDYDMTEFEAFINYKRIIPACQSLLYVDTNILTSPNHPNTTNCTWMITANFGSYIILNFRFIEVYSIATVVPSIC